MYSSLLILRRSLDILYMVKSYVKLKRQIPSIFVGMIAFDDDWEEDDEKMAEEDPPDTDEVVPVVDDEIDGEPEIDGDPDPIVVKSEPEEDFENQESPHISLKIEGSGSNIDDKGGSDDEMQIGDFDEAGSDVFPELVDPDHADDDSRPSYEPYDPERTEYSTICFSFFQQPYVCLSEGDLEYVPVELVASMARPKESCH